MSVAPDKLVKEVARLRELLQSKDEEINRLKSLLNAKEVSFSLELYSRNFQTRPQLAGQVLVAKLTAANLKLNL